MQSRGGLARLRIRERQQAVLGQSDGERKCLISWRARRDSNSRPPGS
jgi:hypothetical protein